MILICPLCKGSQTHFDLRVQLNPIDQKDVVTCGSCGSFFVVPPLSKDDIARCYPPEYHEDYRSQLSSEYLKGRYIGKKLKAWRPRGRFLDVGCSLGGVVAGVVKEAGWEGVGVEYSAYAVSKAQALFPSIRFYQGGLEDLPEPANPFDFIFVNNVLEHVTDPRAFMQKAFALLNSGGRLRLIVPNGPVDIAPNRILFKKRQAILRTKHAGHIFFFSRKGLEILFREAGFKVLRFGTFHMKTALKAWGLFPPGAHAKFTRQFGTPERSNGHEDTIPDKAWVPPSERAWLNYRLKRLIKWPPLPGLSIGYDFDVLLEK